MENFKQTPENNKVEEKTVIETNENTEKNEGVLVNNTEEEISKKEKIIDSTLNRINNIRSELGLEVSNEIPPSVIKEQDLINDLEKEKYGLESFMYVIPEPEMEETQEEYVERSMKSIVDEYMNKDPIINSASRLLKRAYYGRHANQSMVNFFSNKENSNKIKDLLSKLDYCDNKKFSEEKNNYIFNELSNKVWGSNRESADGDDNKKIDYYNNTNQERDFFSHGRKYDAHSYSSMMFALPDAFIKTKEGNEYLHNKLDDKTIFLFGGGDSIKDLLKSEEFKPKKVINFDPFIKEEAFDKNPNGIYESQTLSASDKKIREMTEQNEIPKADEVWATYSVPFYLDSSEDIKELISNMSQVLNEDGNARICPISVQSTEKNGESFETRKQTLIDSVKSLLDSPDYNVTVFNDTLKIHKIKKEDK